MHEVLTIKNIDIDIVNFKIQQSLPCNAMSFKSIDIVVDPYETVNFTVEFLNSLDLP